jgi:hypothetical protein
LLTAEMIIAPTLRNGDTFRDAVTTAPSATPIERLAAFAGRRV